MFYSIDMSSVKLPITGERWHETDQRPGETEERKESEAFTLGMLGPP
jgi:hypothetical protein